MNKEIWRNFEGLRINPRFLGRACLKDHQLIFDGQSKRRHGATGNIKVQNNSEVWGALFEVNDRQMGVLDQYEGVPTNYLRKQVSVTDDQEVVHEAWVYYRTGQPQRPPSEAYLGEMLIGAQECNLPQSYIQELRKTTTYESAA